MSAQGTGTRWGILGTANIAQATFALRTIRGGGAEFDAKRLITSLETAGCTDVRALPPQGPAPLEYVIGQRAGSVTR